MEQAALFKRFADIDGIDLEVETEDVDEFVACVKLLGASFGGINLEDIKAPECFVIEQRLELMTIPVFDDQHGTAIISAAGLINLRPDRTRSFRNQGRLQRRRRGRRRLRRLIKAMGARPENVILCDTRGVIHQDRRSGMNQWKSAHAAKPTTNPGRSHGRADAFSDFPRRAP